MTWLKMCCEPVPTFRSNKKRQKVTLQLVVNTGNIQIITVEDRLLRTLVDLERDHVKWTRGGLHMDMKNPYSPALSRAADELPEHEQSGPRVRRSGRLRNEVAGELST